MKKPLSVIVTALLLAFPANNLLAANLDQPNSPALQLSTDSYILASATADVTGDGTADSITLTGQKANSRTGYASKMTLVVYDVQTEQSYSLDLGMGGYEGKLFVGDFTGDHIADIFVSAPTGGSGGIVDHRIATFSDKQPTLIFKKEDNKGVSFSGQFLEGWKTEITNTETGKSIIIETGKNRADYIRLGIYNEAGHVLKETKPWNNHFSLLEPIDPDNDGTYELKGYQRIVGAYNADPLAVVETQWKYENNSWAVRQIKVAIDLLNNPVRATTLPAPAANTAFTIKTTPSQF